MAEAKGRSQRSLQALEIQLTDDQKRQIQDFWSETGGIGNVEIKVDVVNDRVSPASIQVGTAR